MQKYQIHADQEMPEKYMEAWIPGYVLQHLIPLRYVPSQQLF